MNCGACESSLGDLKTEMDLKSSIIKTFHHPTESSRPSTQTTLSIDFDSVFAQHNAKLVRIQAFWRGRQERKAVYHLLKTGDQPNSYFTKVYALETLRTGQPLPCIVDHRPAYRYCTGAQYSGHWRGGFRHGQGVMTWPDGAKYDGAWNFGYAAGKGTFELPSGESFTGTWRFSKSCLRVSLMLDSPRESGRMPEDGYGNASLSLAGSNGSNVPPRAK